MIYAAGFSVTYVPMAVAGCLHGPGLRGNRPLRSRAVQLFSGKLKLMASVTLDVTS